MKLLGYIILACMALALLKVAVMALIIGLGLAFLIALVRRPEEAMGFALLVIAANHPWPFAAVVLCLAIVRLLTSDAP